MQHLSKRAAGTTITTTGLCGVLVVGLVFSLRVASIADEAPAKAASPFWTEFRGKNGTGVDLDQTAPEEWSESKNVRWKTVIHGKGHSSPVIWGKQVWLTTASEDGHKLYGVCVNLETGEIEHDLLLFEVAEPQFCHPMNSYASSTPAIESGRVYLHFGSPGTACVDTTTGTVIWRRTDFVCNHFRGPASSPIVDENRLILTFDGSDFQFLAALDKFNGETIWRTDRKLDYGTDDGDYKKGYGTPSLFEISGRRELVSPSAAATAAYDPKTGNELWRVRHGGMNASARPLRFADQVVVCTASGGDRMLSVRLGGTGDVTESNVLWRYNKSAPTMPNPILIDKSLWVVADNGVLTRLNPESGEQTEQKRLPGEYSSSPIRVGNRVYFFNKDGVCSVLAANDSVNVIATNELDEGCLATPAVAEDSLIVRTKSTLYRLENRSK